MTKVSPEWADTLEQELTRSISDTRSGMAAFGRGMTEGFSALRAVSVCAGSQRSAEKFAGWLMDDPERMAAFIASKPDPVVVACLAGKRAVDNLGGTHTADRSPSTALERLSARVAQEHLDLAKENPARAAKLENRWARDRRALDRGPFAGRVGDVRATYCAAVGVNIAEARGTVAAESHPADYKPVGVMRELRIPPAAGSIVRDGKAQVYRPEQMPALRDIGVKGGRAVSGRVVRELADAGAFDRSAAGGRAVLAAEASRDFSAAAARGVRRTGEAISRAAAVPVDLTVETANRAGRAASAGRQAVARGFAASVGAMKGVGIRGFAAVSAARGRAAKGLSASVGGVRAAARAAGARLAAGARSAAAFAGRVAGGVGVAVAMPGVLAVGAAVGGVRAARWP